MGIGLSAFIASALLMYEKTRKWSDQKIVIISVIISFSSVLLLLRILNMV